MPPITRSPWRRLAGTALAVSLTASALLGASVISPEPASAASSFYQTQAFFNDPSATGDASNVTRNLIIDHFDHTPRGATVRMAVWSLSDTGTSAAMVRAMQGGVHVQAIIANSNCSYAAAKQAIQAAAKYSGSWVNCVKGSTRVAGGTMHQKSYTFSSIGYSARGGAPLGGIEDVTVVGSANPTVNAYANQWVDMFQFVNRADVYQAYVSVFGLQAAGRHLSKPYRSYSFRGGNGLAQFYPVNSANPSAKDDPAHYRLSTLPKGPGTTITVAMYSWHDIRPKGKSYARGSQLATDLIALRKAGAHVTVLTGPPVSDKIEARLRANKITVVRAFEKGCTGNVTSGNCNYIHLKAMSATYIRGGARQYRVWTGSDNWTWDSLRNDEVAHKIAEKGPYDQYAHFFRTIQCRYSTAC